MPAEKRASLTCVMRQDQPKPLFGRLYPFPFFIRVSFWILHGQPFTLYWLAYYYLHRGGRNEQVVDSIEILGVVEIDLDFPPTLTPHLHDPHLGS